VLGPRLSMCTCACVCKLIAIGAIALIMVLNDSDNTVDLFILHPRNAKCVKINQHNFLLYSVWGTPDCGPLAHPLPSALTSYYVVGNSYHIFLLTCK